MAQTRKLYQGSYVDELYDELNDTSDPKPAEGTTQEAEPTTPEEVTFKKRYGDLRTYNNSLTERIKQLETQLQAANKKEIKLPSTEEELGQFAQKYPDLYRHVQAIAMKELLKEKEDLATETLKVKEDFNKVERELGMAKILKVHPDFEALQLSEKFHEWARVQPQEIQDWLFESSDYRLCIKAIDIYKAEQKPVEQPVNRRPSSGADNYVPTRTNSSLSEAGSNKKVWTVSEIQRLNPKQYERFEAEIDAAREEGRIALDM